MRNETFTPEVGEHLMEEIETEGMLRFLIKVQYMSPLKTDGKVSGVMLINRCRPAV